MSVVVKGMEIPKSCRECPFENYYSDTGKTVCMASLRVLAIGFGIISFDGRHSLCPIVALPDKHGDLIDRDEFKETIDYYIREAGWSDEHNEALTWVKDDFIDAEMVIVEAEDEP